MEEVQASSNGVPHINSEYWMLIFRPKYIIVRDKRAMQSFTVVSPEQIRSVFKHLVPLDYLKEVISLAKQIMGKEVEWDGQKYQKVVKQGT
jgi:hypothetical protein